MLCSTVSLELIPQIAQKAGIDPIMVALPMQCMSNLFRSMSPVAAVIIIVSASVKVNPLVLVKRTWVPLMSGVVVVLAAFILQVHVIKTVRIRNCLH